VRRLRLHGGGEEGVRAARAAARGLLIALALSAVAGCVTIPEKTHSQWLGVLPERGTVYISVSVPPSRTVIQKALKNAGPGYGDISTLLDMSKRLYCSLTLVQNEPSRFSAVAVGNYPSTLMRWRLGSSGWKKTSGSGGTWYENAKAGLEISAPAKSVVLVSNGDIEGMLPRLRQSGSLAVPPDVVADMETADLLIYMPELPGGIAEKSSGGVSIPIREVWLDARKSPGGYQIGGTINLGTEKEARLFSMVLKLAVVGWMRSQSISNPAERLQALSITPDGSRVILSGFSLTDDEVIPMFLSLVKDAVPLQEAAQ
jgi:hypothetical protein